jgi:hypothetical protein
MKFVEERLAELMPLHELYPAFRKQFGVGQRCAERYVARVHAQWAAEVRVDREAKRAEIEHAADAVFRAALTKKDFRSANAALDLKSKLHGLQRTEVSGPNGGPIPHAIDADALCERIEAFAAGRPAGARTAPAAGRAAADDAGGAGEDPGGD